MKTFGLAATLAAVLMLSGCQKAAQATPAQTATAASQAPAGSAAAVQRISAMPMETRCGGDWPGHPAPTANAVIDLGGGAFAVLMDCYSHDGQPAWKSLHVQGADGMLKSQPLILFNGAEADYEEGFDWEPSLTSEATWDAAKKELVWADTFPPVEGETSSQVRTMRWRWDGSKMVMVSATLVTHATPDAPATDEVIGWPKAGKPDPTPVPIPV